MTIYTCNNDFMSMMTCIYVAWASRKGHANVKLMKEPVYEQVLFSDYVHVDADEVKADSVIRAIREKISNEAYLWVYYASRSADEDSLDVMYRFLVMGFHYGSRICYMLQNPVVVRMMELKRNVGNEAHAFREFLRFSSIDNKVYVAHIEPKSDVLMMVANHFNDRMMCEHWIIMDDTRNVAAIHPRNSDYYIRYLTDDEAKELLKTEQYKDEFVAMWKEYFDTIAIRERTNPKCQRNHFPVWMRKNAVEFNE